MLVAAACATSGIVDVEIGPGRQTATLDLGTQEVANRVVRQLLDCHLLLHLLLRCVLEVRGDGSNAAILLMVDLRQRIRHHEYLLVCHTTSGGKIRDLNLTRRCHRNVFLIVLLALGMLSPMLITGSWLSRLKRLQHLHIFLIDLLDLLLTRAEIESAWGARHGHED